MAEKVWGDPKVLLDRCYVQELASPKRAYPCGHTRANKFVLWLFGRQFFSEHLDNDKCPQCLLEEKRKSNDMWRCAICGKAIFVGEKVRRCDSRELSESYRTQWATMEFSGCEPELWAAICSTHSGRGVFSRLCFVKYDGRLRHV